MYCIIYQLAILFAINKWYTDEINATERSRRWTHCI